MTEPITDQTAQFNELMEAIRHLDGAVESLILNETAVLEGLAQMLNAIHQMQTRSEETQKKLGEQLHQFSSLITSHFEDRTTHKPIVISAAKSNSQTPEIGLLRHLYSHLQDNTAVDVGAHVGETAEQLLAAGYSVIAFEPCPASFAEVAKKASPDNRLRAWPAAIGSADGKMDLHIATDVSGKRASDPSLFHTLSPHSANQNLDFTKTIPVTVRSLGSLVRSKELPQRVGLLKIDTEGFDLEVIRGMGELQASVIMAEFWDAQHEFGKSGRGRLEDLVIEMKKRGYHWYLILYHVDYKSLISYYHNRCDTIPDSWGNVLFFHDQRLFAESLRWVEEVLPPTLFR